MNLKYDEPLSNLDFNFNLRHYKQADGAAAEQRVDETRRLEDALKREQSDAKGAKQRAQKRYDSAAVVVTAAKTAAVEAQAGPTELDVVGTEENCSSRHNALSSLVS